MTCSFDKVVILIRVEQKIKYGTKPVLPTNFPRDKKNVHSMTSSINILYLAIILVSCGYRGPQREKG